MTVAFAAAGTVGAGSTTATPGLPAGLVDGNVVWVVAVSKPDTTTHAMPAEWSLAGTAAGGGGTVGNGTGPTRVSMFFRVKDPTWTTIPAVTCTNGNSAAAQAFRYTRDTTKALDVASAGGAFSGNTTAWSALMASDPGITAGDLVLLASSTQDEAPSWSNETFTATGLTLGTATERAEAIEGTTGNDVGGWLADRPVTAGTATAAAVVTATSSVASRGATLLVRVREVAAAEVRTSTGAAIARGSASGATSTLRTRTGTAQAVGSTQATATSTRTTAGSAAAKASATVTSATTRTTQAAAIAKASATAVTDQVIPPEVHPTTGQAIATASATATTGSTRTTTATAPARAAASAQTATAHTTTAAAGATGTAAGDTATTRPQAATAAATTSAQTSVTTVRITLADALAHALATGTASGGTGAPPEVHTTTGIALTQAAAQAATTTLRSTLGVAASHATAAGTATRGEGEPPPEPTPEPETTATLRRSWQATAEPRTWTATTVRTRPPWRVTLRRGWTAGRLWKEPP